MIGIQTGGYNSDFFFDMAQAFGSTNIIALVIENICLSLVSHIYYAE